MINQQIRHLQSRDPFETFSIELASGRVIQIRDRHQVATTDGVQLDQAVIGVLYASGTFELINASPGRQCQRGAAPKGQGRASRPEGAAGEDLWRRRQRRIAMTPKSPLPWMSSLGDVVGADKSPCGSRDLGTERRLHRPGLQRVPGARGTGSRQRRGDRAAA
jgi:hypothetical protein